MMHIKVLFLSIVAYGLAVHSIFMCSDESLLQEDNSLSAELGSLHLRDSSRQTIGSSRLLDIQSHEIASANPSSINQRYYSMMRN
jgi:hypothetical protein